LKWKEKKAKIGTGCGKKKKKRESVFRIKGDQADLRTHAKEGNQEPVITPRKDTPGKRDASLSKPSSEQSSGTRGP